MNNLYTIQNDEEYLEHHGILGQRWGHKNGPPYPIAPGDRSAAEKKAGAESGSSRNNGSSSDTGNVKNISRKLPKSKTKEAREKASKMTDKELDQAINRLKKEKEYIELQGKTITQGQNFVENMVIIAGTTLVTTLVTKGSTKAGEAIVAGLIKKKAGDAVFKAIYPKK